MADDFDDDMDGRLVIATTDDDERMDCSGEAGDNKDVHDEEQLNKNASTLTTGFFWVLKKILKNFWV